MTQVGLCARLTDLLSGHLGKLGDGEGARALRDAVAALGEPLPRLAVGGRLKAGKSTLVNALLGTGVAATGHTETTTVVSRFHHARKVSATLHTLDGKSAPLSLDARGRVPARLDAPLSEVDHIAVGLPSAVLAERFTLVDTPGVDSLSGLDPGSERALAEADAVLYVMPHPGDNDNRALLRVREQAAGSGLTAANVLGVLSRVDQLSDGEGDPWPIAHRVAANYSAKLRGVAGGIVPVLALLAHSATEFDDADTAAVLKVRALPAPELEDVLYSAEDFLTMAPLPDEHSRRLMSALGMYGIRALVASTRTDTGGFAELLRETSQVDPLLERITTSLAAGSDRLRCTRVLANAEAATWRGTSPAEKSALGAVRAELDRFRGLPELGQVRLAGALTDVLLGRCELPEDEVAALERLATGTTTAACLGLPEGTGAAELADAADDEIDRWRAWENTPSAVLSRHARDASELCQRFFFAQQDDNGGLP
ncbi:dynamin family protein [Amycolatopsis sp. cg5]|uniref:dynamin family protein n=1 Tax=Amycolatopsis sp. cg5 TaxID=3238802 RepID=UPI00352698B3